MTDPTPDTAADTQPTAEAERARRGRRGKNRSLLLLVAAGALSLLSWTQSWSTVIITMPSGGEQTLAIDGSVAAPALTALSLSLLALVAALAIAGRGFRLILGVLAIVLGLCIALESVLSMTDPGAAAAAAITATTGIAGSASVHAVIVSAASSAWPFLALAGAVLAVLGGALILATARNWPGSSRKYQTVTPRLAVDPESTPDAIDSWDDLSRGDDPTRLPGDR